MDCKHTVDMLEGRADGIYCRGCGQVFKTMPKQTVEVKAPAKEPEAKKTTKGGKK